MTTADLEVEHPLLQVAGHEHLALLAGVEEDALGVRRLEGDIEVHSRFYRSVVCVQRVHQVRVAQET